MRQLLIFFFLFLTSCLFKNDDDMSPPEPIDPIDQLPPITMEGANTFGCLMNGEAWIPKSSSFVDDDLDVIYDESNSHLQIHTNLIDEPKNQNMVISIYNFFEIGDYEINYKDDILINFENGVAYELDTLSERILTISKIDFSEKIVSGTFNFNLINREFNDTLKITNGRFDAIYRN